jgi:hypothetical protein
MHADSGGCGYLALITFKAKFPSAMGYTKHNETRLATMRVDRHDRMGSVYSKRSIAVHSL